MEHRFETLHDGRALRAVVAGPIPLVGVLEFLEELRARTAGTPLERVLIDARESGFHPSIPQALEIARVAARVESAQRVRLALLTRTMVGFGLARMVGQRLELVGGPQLTAFDDPRKAESWLAGEPEPPRRPLPPG